MVTRLYFHAALNSLANLPTTEQSSLTSNKDVDAQSVNRLMNTTIGTAEQSLALTSNATTSIQRYYFTRFVSLPLSGITSITAQTWKYNFSTFEPNVNGNFPVATGPLPVRITCYVWRPSTQTKVGDILDSNSASTVNEGTGVQRSHTPDFTGALVSSIQDGDVICFEVWFEITQALPSALSDTFYFDGTTSTLTEAAVTSNYASYIETPQNLTFGAISNAFTRALPTETVAISESLTKQFTSSRALPTQTTVISESLQRTATNSRALATQTTAISETSASVVTNTRALPTQTVPISESLSEVYSANRALPIQTVTIGETSASLVTNTRALPIQTVAISETLSEMYAANRALPVETIPISESRSAVRTLSRVLSVQTIGISEGLIRRYQANRPLPAETIAISESRSVVRTLTRLLTETVPINEILSEVYAAIRTLPTQTVPISESLDSIQTSVRALPIQTVVIGESLVRRFNGIRALPDEIVTVDETLSESYAATRTLPTQVVAIGESLARKATNQRILATQTVPISESLSETYAANRALPTQVVTIGETIAKVFTGNRALPVQTTVIAETLSTGKAFFRTAIETTTISETLARTFTGIRLLPDETIPITESRSRLYGAIRPLAVQTTTISETLARLYAANRILATETTIVSGGTLARLLTTFRTQTETIPITELLVRQFIGSRLLATQTTSISDSVAILYGLAPPPGVYERLMPLELVPITDTLNRVVTNSRAIGGIGVGVSFDGINDYVDCKNDASLWSQPLTKFSWSVWIYSQAQGGTRYVINHGSGAQSFGCYQPATTTDRFNFRIVDAAAGNHDTFVNVGTSILNRWVHLVGVYDSTLVTNNLKVYGDAVLGTGGATFNLQETINLSNIVTLSGSTADFQGYQKDFRWYTNKALTPAEITDLYNNSGSAPIPNYWLRMNEGVGNPIDSISGTKTATLSNGATWFTSPGETVPITESLVRSYGTARLLPTETIPISDSLDRQLAFTRTAGLLSMTFDGVNDYLDLGTASVFDNLVTGFTWTILLTPTQGGTPYRTIIRNQSYPSPGGFELWYGGATPSQRYLEFKYDLNGTNYFHGQADIGINNKGLCVISWDNITKKSFCKFGAFSSTSGVRPANQTFDVGLGLQIARSGSGFAGNIYEIRFFRRALTIAEISDIENNISALTPDFWLKMNEGTGAPLDSIAAVPVTNNGAGWAVENEIVPISESLVRQAAFSRQMGRPSILYDGIDDSITIPNTGAINNLDDFTISLWVYPTSIGTSTPHLFQKFYANANSFIVYFTSPSYLVSFRTVNNALTNATSASTYIQTNGINRWYHILVTFNRTTGLQQLFIDGVLRDSDTNTGVTANTMGGVSNLTLNGGGGAAKWGGNVRDFRLYRSELTGADILKVYNDDPTAPTPDYWQKMEEGSGLPIDEISGINTMTLNAGAGWAIEPERVPIAESSTRRATNQRIMPAETIPITESQIRTYSATRILPTEIVPIDESSDRIFASVRTFVENTAISESLERLVSIFRSLDEVVPISESLNKVLILIRALPAETTILGETLARTFTGVRTMPTQTTTIGGGSLTKVFSGIRALPTQVVNVTSSVARLLAANRAMPPETISISEQLKKSYSTIRTLLDTVVITESLQRLYAGARYLVEDVIILESLRTLAKIAKVSVFVPPAPPQRRPETRGPSNVRVLHPDVDSLDYRSYLKENPPMSERKWSPSTATTQKRKKIETKNDLDDIDIQD